MADIIETSTQTYTQPVSELIRRRYSCRTYREAPIPKKKRERLSAFAASLGQGPLGTRARFALVAGSEQDRSALNDLGTYGFIKGATGFIVGATGIHGKNLEDFGYLMERIVLYATDLGLGTCWLGGTFTKSSFAEKIRRIDGELVPAVVSTGEIASKRGLVDRIIRRGANAERRRPWEALFFDGTNGAPLSRLAAGAYAEPLEMVRLGPSASNRQPWRVLKDRDNWHFYLERTPGYRERRLVRMFTVADMQRMDMGIAMCHFELAASELGLRGRWEVSDPGVETPDVLREYTVSWVGNQGTLFVPPSPGSRPKF